MEELENLASDLRSSKLQLRSLQRTARTTLQVTSALLDRVDEALEALNNAQSKEDTAYDYFRSIDKAAV